MLLENHLGKVQGGWKRDVFSQKSWAWLCLGSVLLHVLSPLGFGSLMRSLGWGLLVPQGTCTQALVPAQGRGLQGRHLPTRHPMNGQGPPPADADPSHVLPNLRLFGRWCCTHSHLCLSMWPGKGIGGPYLKCE